MPQDAQARRLVGLGGCERVGQGQRDHFPHPQASPPHQREPGPITRLTDDRPQRRHVRIAQITRQALGLLAGVALRTDRVRPGQIAALLGQKVEEDFEGRNPALDGRGAPPGLALVINKCIDVVHCHLTPGCAAKSRKLSHIANVIDGRAPLRRTPPQVLLEGLNAERTIHEVHELLTFCWFTIGVSYTY